MTNRQIHKRFSIDRLPSRNTYLLESLESRTFLSAFGGHWHGEPPAGNLEADNAAFEQASTPGAQIPIADANVFAPILSQSFSGGVYQASFGVLNVEQSGMRTIAIGGFEPIAIAVTRQAIWIAVRAMPSRVPPPPQIDDVPASEATSQIAPASAQVAARPASAVVKATNVQSNSQSTSSASELLEMIGQPQMASEAQSTAGTPANSPVASMAVMAGTFAALSLTHYLLEGGAVTAGSDSASQTKDAAQPAAAIVPIVEDSTAGAEAAGSRVFDIASLASPYTFLSDSLAEFVEESASIPRMLAQAQLQRPWLLTFTVLAADIALLAYLHRRRAKELRRVHVTATV